MHRESIEFKRAFSKYHGAGNDFLFFEDFEETFPAGKVSSLCDRQSGIGADGLILVRHSQMADFQMVYFNQDGSIAALCGNGLRCFAHFLFDLGIHKSPLQVETGNQVLTVIGKPPTISIYLPLSKVIQWERPLKNRTVFAVETGVPHLVIFVEEEVDVVLEGRAFRNDPSFAPEGVNVNFVRMLSGGRLAISTYERGVEGETLACGTGVASAAFVAHKLGKVGKSVEVIPRSGEVMRVILDEEIEVMGPSTKMFEGSVEV